MASVIDWAAAHECALVLRTDHTDDRAWRGVVAALQAGVDPDDYLDHDLDDEPPWFLVDDPGWTGAGRDEVLSAVAAAPARLRPSVVFLADANAMREPHPLLVVSALVRADCEDDDYEDQVLASLEFRILPDAVDDVHSNLLIANMDFAEFVGFAGSHPQSWYTSRADPVPAAPAPAGPRCDGTRLRRGEILRDGAITSPSGCCTLSRSQDGVVLHGPVDTFVTLRSVAGPVIEVTDDALLQTYRPGGGPFALILEFDLHGGRPRRWPKDERGRPGLAVGAHALLVRDDGDIDLVDETDQTLYSFGTSHHLGLLAELWAIVVTRPRDHATEELTRTPIGPASAEGSTASIKKIRR